METILVRDDVAPPVPVHDVGRTSHARVRALRTIMERVRVHVDPIPKTLSRAMHRVGNALRAHAPEWAEIVDDVGAADVEVMHVIGADAIPYAIRTDRKVAVIQYCFKTAGAEDRATWLPLWDKALTTWSYYDLGDVPRFYHAPLGIDPVFLQPGYSPAVRDITLSSGYVSGRGAEAIEEFALASARAGLRPVHLGPRPVGMSVYPKGWQSIHDCDDRDLADTYRRARYVSGLRHVEGFELPVVEGLACGAIPICFDRPESRRWFNHLALFVPECDGAELVEALTEIMTGEWMLPSIHMRAAVARDRFDWATIARGFWARVQEGL